MAIKKTKSITPSTDPVQPVNRPVTSESINSTWGKTLTKPEWTKLMLKLDQKKKDREMSKLSDTLQRALDKKQGKTLPDEKSTTAVNTKVKKGNTPPTPTGNKPARKAAGRGR